MYLIKEYPKAIASLIAIVLINYFGYLIPEEMKVIAGVNLETVLSGVLIVFFGRYIRLTKEESYVLDNIQKTESKNQIIND